MTQPRIGAHVSIAGGMFNAPGRAKEEGAETFQCFSRSPQGGPAPKLTEEILSAFQNALREAQIDRFYIHAPYYINFGSLEAKTRHASRRIIREELERGSLLGASYVMFHPGSHTGQTLEEGITRVQKGISEVLEGYTGSCQLLVEISAGAGNVLGDTFEEVAAMIEPVRTAPGFGEICFDTCHAFASGYDFRTPQGAKEVLATFDRTIGLSLLKLSHVQDSKVDLGGRRDRHEHIGQGFVGQEGLKNLLQTKPFQAIDWILETEPEGRAGDMEILKAIRG